MLYLLTLILLSASSENTTASFSSTAPQETQLWKQELQNFLSKNPKAQFLQQHNLEAVFVPPKSPSGPMVVLSSGIHGTEAITGSTLQRLFLQKWPQIANKSGLLLLHVINPDGFAKGRRTNSQNVDLNRNFSTEPLPDNTAYRQLQNLLEPQEPASTSFWSKWSFFLQVGWHSLRHGKSSVLKTLSGQNHSAKGLYYSGTEPQFETLTVQKWIVQYTQDTAVVLHIDLHTGFGENGKLHYFGSDEFRNPEQLKDLKKVFPQIKIDTANDADFYKTHGDFSDWTWKTLKDKKVIPMVYEFGTRDSQTLLGGLESLWISVIENQGHHYGYKTSRDERQTQDLFQSLFNPQDTTWQREVLAQGEQALTEALFQLEAHF